MSPLVLFFFKICGICYGLALFLELLRFRMKTHYVGTFFALVGFVFHTFFLYQQHIAAAHPLDGPTMFFLVSAWGLALIYIIWTFSYADIPFGIVLLPLIILLCVVGFNSITVIESPVSSFRSLAKMLHAAPAAGTLIALAIAFTCCIFYVSESYLLRKRWSFSPPLKLPSLEWSFSVFRIACVVAIGCLCLCVLGGILLNIHRDNVTLWQDPVVVGTLCLLFIPLLGLLKWLFCSPSTTENRFVFMLVVIIFIAFLSVLVGVLASKYDAHWNRQQHSISLFSIANRDIALVLYRENRYTPSVLMAQIEPLHDTRGEWLHCYAPYCFCRSAVYFGLRIRFVPKDKYRLRN